MKKIVILFLLLSGASLFSEFHLAWVTAVPDTIYDDDNLTYSEIEVCIQDENNDPVSGERVDFECDIGNCLPYDFTNFQGLAETTFWESNDGPGTATILIIIDNTILGEIQVEILPLTSAEDEIPVSIISQNFPNPFKVQRGRNSGTTISFSIYSKEKLTLDGFANICIFNIKGEKIRIYNKDLIPTKNSYRVWWDGKDSSGKIVNSGIYLYTISAEDIFVKGKMTLIK